MLASLLAGLIVLMIWEREWKLWLRIIAALGVCGVTLLIRSEWMIVAPVTILALYLLRDRPVLRFCVFTLIMLIHQFACNGFVFYLTIGSIRYLIAEIAAMLVISFLYNGEKGHFPGFSKWVFYIFYPAHLILGYILQIL